MMTKICNFIMLGIVGLSLSSLGGALTGCTVQNNKINPMVSPAKINQGLPIFINAPAINVKIARSDLSVPQNSYLIIRDGYVLNRYESAQSFNQIFNTAFNQAVLGMQFQASHSSPYVLNAHIDFLKIKDAGHENKTGLLKGKLVASYSLKFNNILIWNERFESNTSMPYARIQDEGQAVSGSIQALVSNNLGQFGQGLHQACVIKPQGITC